MHPHDNNDTQPLTKMREQLSVQIRRETRLDIISKRRNLLFNQHNNQLSYQNTDAPIQSLIEQFRNNNYTVDHLAQLVKLVHSNEPAHIYEGTIGIRKILSQNDDLPVQAVVDANVVPRLIEFARQDEYPNLKIEASWALTNIASGNTVQCQSIVDKGGIGLFMNLLGLPFKNVVSQAIWALGNIGADSSVHRDTIIKMGGIQKLKQIIDNSTEKNIHQQGGWALANLCRGSPKPNYESVKEAVDTFAYILKSKLIQDHEVVSDILWALSFLSDGSKTRISRVVNTGVVSVLVQLLASDNVQILIPSMRTLGNIAYGNELHTQQIIKNGAVPHFERLLSSERFLVRRETCWVLSNIAAGVRTQALAIIHRPSLVAALAEHLENDRPECQREIAWIFCNASQTCQPLQIVTVLKEYNLIYRIAKLLDSLDDKTVLAGLDTISSMLRAGELLKGHGGENSVIRELHSCGGLEKMQDLQTHLNQDVYKKVLGIVETFFVLEEQVG